MYECMHAYKGSSWTYVQTIIILSQCLWTRYYHLVYFVNFSQLLVAMELPICHLRSVSLTTMKIHQNYFENLVNSLLFTWESLISGYLLRFIQAANLLGFPAITVPVRDSFVLRFLLYRFDIQTLEMVMLPSDDTFVWQ